MLNRLSRNAWPIVALTSVAAAAFVPGCLGQEEPDHDEAYGDYAVEALTSACTPSAIRAGTPASRLAIIDRALNWVSRRAPYSQTPQSAYGGYRTDCSGLVSMAWGLPPPGNTTHSFAGGAWDNHRSRRITWGELESGDALNNPDGHIALFAGWLDENHTRFCTVEEYNWGHPASIIHHTIHDISHGQPYRAGYLPIRFTTTPPGASASPGGGGSSGGSACFSQTLGRSMPAGSCVESRFDRTWYHCSGGSWVAGQTGCTSTNPLASSGGGSSGNSTCHSDTLGRTVTEGTCVESRFDRVWYQCTDTGWVHNPSIASSRRGPIGACTSYNQL